MSLERTAYLRQFRTNIDQHFNVDEVRLLCFDLSVDYDHLMGDAKPLRIQSLIMHLAQRGRLGDLLELVQSQRPGVEWPSVPPASQQIEDEQSLQVVKFREPLLRAALDLQGRLYNIIFGFFLKIYYHKSEDDREYAINSTLYNIGEYLGWIEIMRREGQFLDLGDVASNRRVEELLRNLSHAFNRDDLDHVFRLFRAEQRAIGEIMIAPQSHSTDPTHRCIGYAEFVERLDEPSFSRWFKRLRSDVELVADEHKQHEQRMIMLYNGLADLIDFLDPQAIYASKKHREKIVLPEK